MDVEGSVAVLIYPYTLLRASTTPFVPIFSSISLPLPGLFPGGEVNIEKNVLPPEFTILAKPWREPWRGLRGENTKGKEKERRRRKRKERREGYRRRDTREIVIFHFSAHNTGTMTRAPRERSIVVGKPDAPFASGREKLKRKEEEEGKKRGGGG